jgi:hypothetical protein
MKQFFRRHHSNVHFHETADLIAAHHAVDEYKNQDDRAQNVLKQLNEILSQVIDRELEPGSVILAEDTADVTLKALKRVARSEGGWRADQADSMLHPEKALTPVEAIVEQAIPPQTRVIIHSADQTLDSLPVIAAPTLS